MKKVAKKEKKINYLKTPKNLLDEVYSPEYQRNSINNDINTTLTNISNQLKNIALIDKSKELKLLNSSFRTKRLNYNSNPNIINNINNNNYINSSLNIEKNQNNQNKSNFFDTSNLDINNKFQNLQKKRVCDFLILKSIKYENYNYDEIQKENDELKENIKFLLKQIKKYQKNGMTIEDMNANREEKMQKLENEVKELKQELNICRNKIIILNKSNNELQKENNELKIYINDNMEENNNNNIKENENIYEDNYMNDPNYLSENNINENNLNLIYKKNINKNEDENEINSNSKLSEELLYDINKQIFHDKNKKYSNLSYLSEGKLYCRKNIKNLSFNNDTRKQYNYKQKNQSNKTFTYSKNFLKK